MIAAFARHGYFGRAGYAAATDSAPAEKGQ
jgi:hypothetical protein